MQLKKIFNSLTLTSICWLALGALGIFVGLYWLYRWRLAYMYPTFGLIALGGGGIVCGLTNGFTDQSPFGRKLSKFGLLFLIIGILMIGYYAYRFI